MENCKQEIRELYCPGHFGNWYEAAYPGEMAAYLKELKEWGFNWYGDWLTPTDTGSPNNDYGFHTLSQELLERKRKHYLSAQKLGFRLGCLVTPNHVFLDQIHPEYAAQKGERVFGQLICPSHPQAREIILGNMTAQLKFLAAGEVRLSALTGGTYDFGGCLCQKCSPWIITWAELIREIHQIAREDHPGIALRLLTWWWTEEEHQLMEGWLKKHPGLVESLIFHIPYDRTTFSGTSLSGDYQKLSFVHIGYGDKIVSGDRDVYGKRGPVVAPQRLEKTLKDTHRSGAEGFMAYSEGCFDDLNKAILGSLSSGRVETTAQAIELYAQRYLTCSSSNLQSWREWLLPWGEKAKVDLGKAEKDFQALVKEAPSSWRVEHWQSKLNLEKINREIGSGTSWAESRDRLANLFLNEYEHLCRDLYRLGPLRHVFVPEVWPPDWFPSWVEFRQKKKMKMATLLAEA